MALDSWFAKPQGRPGGWDGLESGSDEGRETEVEQLAGLQACARLICAGVVI